MKENHTQQKQHYIEAPSPSNFLSTGIFVSKQQEL